MLNLLFEFLNFFVLGTPGRLAQLAEKGSLKLNSVEIFTIDECDEVLGNLQLREPAHKLFTKCPAQKQVLMCTTVLLPNIKSICMKHMQNPVDILIEVSTIIKELNLITAKIQL